MIYAKQNREVRTTIAAFNLELNELIKNPTACLPMRKNLVNDIIKLREDILKNILNEQDASKDLFFNARIHQQALNLRQKLIVIQDLEAKSDQQVLALKDEYDNYVNEYKKLLAQHKDAKKTALEFFKDLYGITKTLKRYNHVSFFKEVVNKHNLNKLIEDTKDTLNDIPLSQFHKLDNLTLICHLQKNIDKLLEPALQKSRQQIIQAFPEFKEIFAKIDDNKPIESDDPSAALLRQQLKKAIEVYIHKYTPTGFTIFKPKRAAASSRLAFIKDFLNTINSADIKTTIYDIKAMLPALGKESKLADYLDTMIEDHKLNNNYII